MVDFDFFVVVGGRLSSGEKHQRAFVHAKVCAEACFADGGGAEAAEDPSYAASTPDVESNLLYCRCCPSWRSNDELLLDLDELGGRCDYSEWIFMTWLGF